MSGLDGTSLTSPRAMRGFTTLVAAPPLSLAGRTTRPSRWVALERSISWVSDSFGIGTLAGWRQRLAVTAESPRRRSALAGARVRKPEPARVQDLAQRL